MRDAYARFFEAMNVSPDAFFDFGLREIIHIPLPAARKEWDELKRSVASREPVWIRGYGRNAANTHHFLAFYAELLGNDKILPDPTNNHYPSRLLQRLTGFSKTKRVGCELLSNYQITHVFGRTKNPYAFAAPWNVVYLPKIVDPFTGHEAVGEMSRLFQRRFQRYVFEIYRPMIEEFNQIVTERRTTKRIEAILERSSELHGFPSAFADEVRRNLTPIVPSSETD